MDSKSLTLPFVNIAAYRFVSLDRLPERRRALLDLTGRLGLRGTILLAHEGINLFLSGEEPSVETFLRELRCDPLFAEIEIKKSRSREIAFNRMHVKIKREIIAFGVESIDPRSETSPRLSPQQLREWLTSNKEFVLLDVRNEFEVELGTFRDAKAPSIDSFRDFPTAIGELPNDWKKKPVVTFCTGGIRCEKAAPLLEQAGFEQVYQLDGGILKYFEQCGGQHYDGECFVFDRRVAVDHDLNETDASLCFRCQRVLRSADRELPTYVEGESCLHCHDRQIDPVQQLTRRREKWIRSFRRRLPGSRPYANSRKLNMPARVHGLSLAEAIMEMFPQDDPAFWRSRIKGGLIRYRSEPVSLTTRVHGGMELIHLEPNCVEPDVDPDIQIIEEDEHWIVVNKPAPLPVHPSGRFNRNTLTWILQRADRGKRLLPAHRLDANTSGLQILCKTREGVRAVQEQFQSGNVIKNYLARVSPAVDCDHFTCRAPIGAASGPGGVRQVDATGKSAVSEFRCVRQLDDDSSLILAIPLTGRTNQLRVHLSHLGSPIIGDPMYGPLREGSVHAVSNKDAPIMMLHAWKLKVRHPATGRSSQFEAARPSWAKFDVESNDIDATVAESTAVEPSVSQR